MDKALILIFSASISYAVFLTVSFTSLVLPTILDRVLVDGAIDIRTALRTSGFGSQFNKNKYAGKEKRALIIIISKQNNSIKKVILRNIFVQFMLIDSLKKYVHVNTKRSEKNCK